MTLNTTRKQKNGLRVQSGWKYLTPTQYAETLKTGTDKEKASKVQTYERNLRSFLSRAMLSPAFDVTSANHVRHADGSIGVRGAVRSQPVLNVSLVQSMEKDTESLGLLPAHTD